VDSAESNYIYSIKRKEKKKTNCTNNERLVLRKPNPIQ